MTINLEATSAVPKAPPLSVAPPRTKPVILFAALGGLSVAVGAYVWGRWIFSAGFPHAADGGTDTMAGWRMIGIRVVDFTFLGVAIALVAWGLIRPLVRERRLSLDGMMILGGIVTYWADAFINYYNFNYIYNTHMLQLASWAKFFPGALTPGLDNYPEPLFVFTSYVWYVLGAAVVGCALMRAMQRRWPHLTAMRLLAVVFVFFMVSDVFFEWLFLIRLFQIWAFVAVPKQLAIGAGHWWQFPIYEPFGVAVMCTGYTALRHYKDDRGMTLVERGATDLRTSAGVQTLMRALAVIGCITALEFAYYATYLPFALTGTAAPNLPSYLRAGFCGEGTDYACPNRDYVPIPSTKSLHITPDDPRLPAGFRIR